MSSGWSVLEGFDGRWVRYRIMIDIMKCPPPRIRRLHWFLTVWFPYHFTRLHCFPCPRPERLLPVGGISPAGDMYSWGSWMMGTRRGCVVLNRRRWH
jgi:hypothetical protein